MPKLEPHHRALRTYRLSGRAPAVSAAAAAAVFLAAASVLLGSPRHAAASVTCTRFASPAGADTNAGSQAAPYRTVKRLIESLAVGETGCLIGTAGAFPPEDLSVGKPITLASAPGQWAVLRGSIYLGTAAAGTTLRDFKLDNSSSSRIAIWMNADDVTIANMDITNNNKPNGSTDHNGICILAGGGFEKGDAYVVSNLVVENSRIGGCGDDPHEHSLYLESTRNAHIVDNYLFGNYGFGIAMYPDAQGTLIENNVIYGNSRASRANITFSGEKAGGEYAYDHASSNNVVRFNIITNALTRYNVDSFFPSTTVLPTANVAQYNCVWNAPYGNFGYGTSVKGYTENGNKNVDPLYVDPTAGDFRLQSTSPCLGWGPRSVPATMAALASSTPDFALSATPTSRTIVRGGGTTYSLSLVPSGGFSGSATLSVSGLPSGASATFDPATLDTSAPATLGVTTTAKARVGSYALTVSGTSGSITRSVVVVLQIKRR